MLKMFDALITSLSAEKQPRVNLQPRVTFTVRGHGLVNQWLSDAIQFVLWKKTVLLFTVNHTAGEEDNVKHSVIVKEL